MEPWFGDALGRRRSRLCDVAEWLCRLQIQLLPTRPGVGQQTKPLWVSDCWSGRGDAGISTVRRGRRSQLHCLSLWQAFFCLMRDLPSSHFLLQKHCWMWLDMFFVFKGVLINVCPLEAHKKCQQPLKILYLTFTGAICGTRAPASGHTSPLIVL